MFIIWGIPSCILVVFIEYLFSLLSFSFHDFFPWIILPAGAWIEGIICTIGIYLYVRVKNIHTRYYHRLYATFISILTFCLVFFVAFIGSLQTHTIPSNFSFIRYLSLYLHSRAITGTGYGLIISSHKLNFSASVLFLFIELIGFILGSLTCGFISMQNRNNCTKCKSLLNKKKLFLVEQSNYSLERNTLTMAISSKTSFISYISQNRTVDKEKGYIELLYKDCTLCKKAYIDFIFFTKSKKQNTYKEDKKRHTSISIPFGYI